MIIYHESINHLALTAIVEAGKIHQHAVEPYAFYKQHNIHFFFDLRGNDLFAIMKSNKPSNTYQEEALVTNEHIKALVIEYKLKSFKLN